MPWAGYNYVADSNPGWGWPTAPTDNLPGSTTPPGGAAGLTPTNYNPAYGGIPTLPAPAASAGQAVTGNLGNLNDILQLVDLTNASNLQQATAPYLALPGYQQSLANVGQNIQQMTSGQLPADVQYQIGQAAAERGVAQGGFRNADYLKALGLNSLQMNQQGQASMNAATAALPRPALMNPQSMFVTPAEQQQATSAQSVYNAAPVPAAAAGTALAATQAGMRSGNQPSQIANPYAGGNDTASAIADLLRRYSGQGPNIVNAANSGANPTQGWGELVMGSNDLGANQGIDNAEDFAWWDYLVGNAPNPQTDYSNYFDVGDTTQIPDYSGYA
jgi:hypothetical protein